MSDGILHILSPLSAPWCGWVMVGLFLCAVLSEVFQPGVIMQSPLSLIAQTERTYKDSPANFSGQLLISVFRIGTLSMALCMCFYGGGTFRFGAFAAICGLIVAFILLKMLCNILLDYTFQFNRRFASSYEHYANIATMSICVLYPGLLVLLRIGALSATQWVLGGTALMFLLLCGYRMARTYVYSPMALVYVILYIGTMEVLPLALLYYTSSQILSI